MLTLVAQNLNLNLRDQATSQNLTGNSSSFGQFVGGLLQAVMVISLLMVLLYLVWGAIDWITAGGDSGKIEKARQKINQSIIGILVLASTVALFTLIQAFVGVEVLTFDIATFNAPNPEPPTCIGDNCLTR